MEKTIKVKQLDLRKDYLYGPFLLPLVSFLLTVFFFTRSFEVNFALIVLVLITIYLIVYVLKWFVKNQNQSIVIDAEKLHFERFNCKYQIPLSSISESKIFEVRHKRSYYLVFEFVFEQKKYVILSQGFNQKLFREFFDQIVV